jgi:putative flippase GtrA
LETMVGKLRGRQFVRFIAVGGLNTMFGYGVFSLLALAGMEAGLALLFATVLGVLFNYFTTGRLVFAAKGLGRLPWFIAVYGLTFLVNLWSLRRLTTAGLSPLQSQAMLLPLITVLAFVLNKLLVFRATP